MEMKRGIQLALAIAGCLAATMPAAFAAPALAAQAQNSAKQKQPQKQPAQQQPSTQSQPNGNPFPEDTTSVPVMPSGNAPDIPLSGNGEPIGAAAPVDSDPVRSPEEMAPSDNGARGGFSSSQSGLDNLTPPPDEQPSGKRKKQDDSLFDIMPPEDPKKDVNVGNYYMDQKNWKGALSRFQSALVLDPENPEVYWGLAECQRHLGQFAEARANYLKVMEYDPDSKHSKEAKKALKSPELANAGQAGQK